MRIVVSVPRLVIATVFVGVIIGGSQLIDNTSQAKPIPIQSAPAKHTTDSTSIPESALQSEHPPIPQVPAVAKPRASQTSSASHSTTPALVIKPAASASVSSLAPVDPAVTPTSNTPSNNSSSTTQTPPKTTTGYTSLNWAGYFASTGNYTGISGSWIVPVTKNNTSHTAYDAAWVGIGGVISDDLIQAGTQDTVLANGREVVSAFYETLPNAVHNIASLTVSPGDSIVASLSEITSGQWRVALADTTTGETYTTSASYTSSHSSAEWIEEAPSNTFNHILPLDNFGDVAFTNLSVSTPSGNMTPTNGAAQPVTMISSSGTPAATPSPLGGDDKSFRVIRNS